MTTVALLDRPAVRDAVDASADPVAVRARLARLVEAHPDLEGEVADGGPLLDAVVAVVGASQSLFTVLERDPVAVAMLRDGDGLPAARTADDLRASSAGLAGSEDPLRVLRRWKRQEMVRIAARDLLGLADLRTVGRELAALAETALDVALTVASPRVPMAVVGMGKLGGAELNYASDVDVVFVHDGDAEEAERAARALLVAMTKPTADGIVFRTDADLRPEGRSGALSRSLEGYESYWQRWAQTWEFQALMKARPVAGDATLGAQFVERAQPYVWPDVLDADAVREVRAMKARTEQMLRQRGVAERELKRGPGGIRDIEFAVQLLQLVHGRHDPTIRSRNTLDALERLAIAGYVTTGDARRLDDAYVWLRTVEHRLQLVEEQQTHTLPTDDAARTRLARVLGFRDQPAATAVEAFDAAHQSRVATVRSIHEKLFFAPVLDTIAGVGPLPQAAVEERLAAFGFRDAEQTRAALLELSAGLTRRSRVMQQLLPAVLEWLSQTPDPDLGLLQLRRMTEGYTRASALARTFRETPIAAERTVRLLGSSRVLGLALHRQPEFVEALADDATLDTTPDRDELVAEALDTLVWREDEAGRRAGLRRFKRRHLLRIGARDLVGGVDVSVVGGELSRLADACVEAALQSLEPSMPFAVIGMGRLGGGELSYASDIDVLFVYDGTGAAAFTAAEQTATRLMRAIGETTAEGQTFRIDAGLRPEGRAGPLTRSIDGYAAYYERWAHVWEYQALLRARPVAGDRELGARFLDLAATHVVHDPFPDEWRREIRRMKARVERERVPAGEDPRFHLKLGRGSLSDVEFTVQFLQLQHLARWPELRDPSTLRALETLVRLGLVEAADAEQLAAAYRLCERARNYRYLLSGTPGDSLPVESDEGEQLARMLGYTHQPQTSMREDYRRLTRRARAVVERLFYGRDTS
jgi:glutamate-ammonia-ligase adenylyltransferase